MKLSKLAAKPQLKQLTIDDAIIVENYGEPIEFYIYDRQDMTTFMKLASLENDKNDISQIAELVNDLILDEDGKKVVTDGNVLPTDVMLKVIEVTVKNLGNSLIQTSPTSQAK
jgi:hypothetical protein